MPTPHPRLALLPIALACAALARAQESAGAPPAQDPPVVLGSGDWRFEWVPDWPTLPEGVSLGNTHGAIVTDAAGRVYVNTDTERAVMVFEPDGRLAASWGADFRGGLHGMCIVREGERELLWLAHTGRHEVVQTTLEGEVLATIGWPEASGHYESAGQYRPTGVAVAPNGQVYVADGYGRSWIHVFDAERRYLRSFGGPGEEPGRLRTPHGIWLDTRADPPLLCVADRENHRLQWFDLDGKLARVMDEDLRRPCNVHAFGETLVVADLVGRITLLDGEDRVLAHLGDNPDPDKRAQNGVPREAWRAGEFLSPHSAWWDGQGNLYVMDWNHLGRITKLRRLRD